jgi:very-long-chain ceramide synthase
MPLTVLTALTTVHLLIPQSYTAKFFSLSHFNPSTQLYNKGSSDWPFVITFVLIFTFVRAVLMRYVFSPIFYRIAPHATLRTATRFAEQAWSLLYYSISFMIGLYIIRNSAYWKNLKEVWADYPQIEMDGFFKAYYLVEMAFWIQQVFVLNIEARRKDFWQMFCHHLVTCTLIFMSYTYNVTRVGNTFLCTMDLSDILLSVSLPHPPKPSTLILCVLMRISR